MDHLITLSCPIDKHQDLLLKVSDIVNAQSVDAHANARSKMPITHASKFAKKLLPPPEPEFALAIQTTRRGLLGYALTGILLFTILGNTLISFFIPRSAFSVMLFFGFGTLIAAFIARDLLANNAVGKKILIPLFRKKNATYQETYRQWLVAKKRWEHSYYCQRHGIVFVKGNRQAVAPDAFQSFLLSKEGSSKT
jgi:hypothetical protein